MRKEVAEFAESMEARLVEHEYKGGWQECSIDFLICGLRMNVANLQIAIYEGMSKAAVTKDAADVANYAMMIADRWR